MTVNATYYIFKFCITDKHIISQGPVVQSVVSKKSSLRGHFVKDGRPYLFHSFRNKYFNKISFGNMLYFQNKL